MSLFFCLSGFLITISLYRDPRAGPFLVKRLFRIVPAFLMVISLVYLIGIGLSLEGYLTNLFFVSNYLYEGLGPGTGHLWSICVEIHFYLTIALIVLLLGRRGLWLIPVMAVAVIGLRIAGEVYSSINTHLRVDEILFGGCLALYVIHRGQGFELKFLARNRLIANLILLLVLILWFASSNLTGGWLNYLRPLFASALVGLLLLGYFPRLQKILSSGPLRYLANISYAVYLYHGMMAAGWFETGTSTEKYLLKRPLTFLLTWFAAHLSTFYWEMPLNRFAREQLSRRQKSAYSDVSPLK